MLILYAALKYDYGRPDQGCSFEHYNFYDSLVRMGHDVLYFDIGAIGQDVDREYANRRLLDVVQSERPQALFTVLFRDELDERTLRQISEGSETTTIAWFSDDHWRFDSYSRFRASWFNWSVTTSNEALERYRALGHANVLKSQWGCNTFLYTNMHLAKRFPVSFVGLPHGNRRFVIQALRDAGIDVHTFGRGWDSGRVTQEQMIRIFNESEINLNLANSSAARTIQRRALNVAVHTLGTSRLPGAMRQAGVRALSVVDRQLGGRTETFPEQIKGRNFEVPGCGGLLLTAPAENLEQYYVPGSEIAYFSGTSDLVAQVRRFLAVPDLREEIARAGYARTLREHTYAHRFAEIFRATGLPSPPAHSVLAGDIALGRTDYVL
jgi:spore maturation protein CgeB